MRQVWNYEILGEHIENNATRNDFCHQQTSFSHTCSSRSIRDSSSNVCASDYERVRRYGMSVADSVEDVRG
uniref:Bm13446 n=1 Tax=Brugia malayi TaxID=6279 RepID=A0A1I9GF29_BRUMA|nr:Bm13446 [Brugia malayi]